MKSSGGRKWYKYTKFIQKGCCTLIPDPLQSHMPPIQYKCLFTFFTLFTVWQTRLSPGSDYWINYSNYYPKTKISGKMRDHRLLFKCQAYMVLLRPMLWPLLTHGLLGLLCQFANLHFLSECSRLLYRFLMALVVSKKTDMCFILMPEHLKNLAIKRSHTLPLRCLSVLIYIANVSVDIQINVS